MATFTEFKIYPITSEKAGSLKANASCIIGGVVKAKFVMRGGSNGVFASMPRKEGLKDGKQHFYPDVSFPERAHYDEFQETALAAYNQETGATGASTTTTHSEGGIEGDDFPF